MTDRRTDRRTNIGKTDVQTDERIVRQTGGWKHGPGKTERRTDRHKDSQTNRIRTDSQKNKKTDRQFKMRKTSRQAER